MNLGAKKIDWANRQGSVIQSISVSMEQWPKQHWSDAEKACYQSGVMQRCFSTHFQIDPNVPSINSIKLWVKYSGYGLNTLGETINRRGGSPRSVQTPKEALGGHHANMVSLTLSPPQTSHGSSFEKASWK
ncbi:hypothetical protein QE152_g13284 [Popillia japonica]|uniref:Uncharacterized protein n=1 Tax=Popillia japonica TaxID=7064 RepID=A0AAW1LDM0_POPJA